MSDLPKPSDEARQHSEKLVTHITDEIKRCDGKIDFARFMEMVLYTPGLGYYSAGTQKFGRDGDFITAPEISALFSRCIARQCGQVLGEMGGGDILEFGAGSGVMACDILSELEHLQQLPEKYFILDLSADLRSRQQTLLKRKVPNLLDRVEWINSLPKNDFEGVVLANELIDAMPVHLVNFNQERAEECFVGLKDGGFGWQYAGIENERVRLAMNSIVETLGARQFDETYISEINLSGTDWVKSVASVLSSGMVLIIDYGFPRHEYYHPQRDHGTLMCHYQHRALEDPFVNVGLQDITSHVDFTALAEAAVAAGLNVAGYTTQAHFLVAAGITELLQDSNDNDPQSQIELTQQVKKLTMPGEMGEKFKVLALMKEIDALPLGFRFQDLRHKL
ncbi:MAG: class I SAM-dependent methyltransferase [Gammaproteobacteria bacterium]